MQTSDQQTAKEALLAQIDRAKIAKTLGNARAIAALRKAVPAFKRGDYKTSALAAAEAETGRFTEATTWYIIGGVGAALLGLLMVMVGARGKTA